MFVVLQSKRIPVDLNTFYSNAVSHQQVMRLEQWLAQLGFEQVEVRERVSVHLIHQVANTNYTLSYDRLR